MKALAVFIGVAAGNFAYQLVQADPSWTTALERSWFQGSALFAYYIMDRYVWND